jgi:hypothetical protein
MTHPKPEEWVPYVYGETTSTTRRSLKAHLKECRQCREEIETWMRTRRGLDAWKLTRERLMPQTLMPVLKWAAAAVVVLMAGISVGRSTAPKVDTSKLRAAITAEIQNNLRMEMAQLARQEAVQTASITLDASRRYAEQTAASYAQQTYVLLKRDVDTIAVNADEGLRRTAAQLVQLADSNEPENSTTKNQ